MTHESEIMDHALTVGLQSESLPSLGAEGPFIAALQTGC
jgi:hypothetical protein